MRMMRLKLIAFASVLLMLYQSAPPSFAQDRQLVRPNGAADGQKRVALVIGNGAYQKASKLPNPANDARDMAAKLRELGFEVIGGDGEGIDVGQAAMESLISRFGARLAETKGVGLFFYAGHGVTSGGQNYLVPVDADIPDEDLVKYKAVPVGYVLDKMAAARNPFNLVILDACRNNPFARQWRSLRDIGDSKGLVNSNPAKGTMVLYATQPGGVAMDGAPGSRNGVFTSALLKNLDQPDIELDRMVKLVARDVEANSDEKQSPWKEGLYSGDFYFRRSAEKKPEPQPDNVPTIAAVQEAKAWDLVKNSNDPGDLRIFLKEFPSGANAGNARTKLEELVWQSVKSSTESSQVQAYLDEFPNGANAGAAAILLKRLEKTVSIKAGTLSKATVPGGVEISFAYIPDGSFNMGSENGGSDEKPVHSVRITKGFWMQTTEVTREQWKAVMGTDRGEFRDCAACPIEGVSWDDTQQFIARLNAQNDGFRYRLPTEAEWEYAARSGTTGDYAGQLDAMAWFWQNSGEYPLSGDWVYQKLKDAKIRTRAAGTKQANAWGLHDMHGNVPEWVQDWYGTDYYSKSPATDPTGPQTGAYRVFRGGSWSSPVSSLRSASRSAALPSVQGFHTGFRVVRQ